ncbi:OsmC family protein [Microbacterium caowuchunii]|uniref:OsmC family protein n=1 Tax=Microbacterium caowuchunii TaxID=2614638 RepID=A0A5J6KV90_9MICO|nr:OsmC family protein [Microbacterium caowuchunii]KAA9135629.1 OsmC family protein [Microbacterium caowuchunii]QEV99234.1 OsmC family protein [Microbacterium caowuchunii]
MTAVTSFPVLSDTTPEERAARLTEAGAAWSDRIDAKRSSSQLTFRAEGVGEGSVATRVRSGRHEFYVDEPSVLGGDDVAASPVEYALGALVGCQVVVYRLYAQVLGIQVDDIRITADGDLDAARLLGKDPSVRPGFSAIRVRVEITGPETEERYNELRDAVDANCPVLDLLSNPTPVETVVVKA